MMIITLKPVNMQARNLKDQSRHFFYNKRPHLLPPLIHTIFPRYEVYEVQDNQYGALDENGEWTGLIGMIVNGVSIHYGRFI